MHQLNRLALALALAMPALSQAAPFSIFEARGYAMGGAGVAASEHAAAALYNPALLAAQSDSKNFSLIMPGVGASASGNNGAVKAVMDFNDHNTVDNLTSAANAFSTAYNACKNTSCDNNAALQNAASQVANASQVARTDLGALDGKTYNVSAGAVAVVALPAWTYKGALSMNVEFYGKATPQIASSDLTNLDAVSAATRAYASSGQTSDLSGAYNASTGDINVGANGQYQSKFKVVGAAVTNIGISLARAVNLGNGTLLVGVTPKLQQIRSVAYTADVDNTDFDLQKNKKTDAGFNLDLGLARTFAPGSSLEKVRLGLSVRNLVPRTYKTSDASQDIKLTPQVRVGAAWVGQYATLTSDLDLTANKIIGTGADSSQIFAVGGELNAWNVAKLRMGYRQDLKAKYGAVTAGVSLLGVQLSAAYAKDRELAAMLQFGAAF